MKKGFISALFVSLMIAAPAIVQAEENEKPVLPLELTNILAETVQDLESQKIESDPDTEVQAASIVPASLSSTVKVDSHLQEEESGLLSVGLGLPVIGEVKIDLLAGGRAESRTEKTTSSQNSLLGVEIKNSELLGDVNLEVLKSNQQGESDASSGLVSLDVDHALLGQTHVGVLEGNKSGSSDKANISANFLVVQSKDSMLGNKRLGVGEYTKNNGQHKVDLANFSDDRISTNNIHFGDTATEDRPTAQKSNNNSTDHDGSNQAAVNGNKIEDYSIRENISVANLTDAGNSTVMNQQKENDLDELKKIINQVNESESKTTKLVAASGSVAPSNTNGASTGSAGAANSSGVTGLAAYLAVDYLKEIESSGQVNEGSDEIFDQWQKSPPCDPPQAPFFLIA